MKDISEIDVNLKVLDTLGREDIVLHDPTKEPFSLYGVFYEDGHYARMPFEVAKTVNDGVRELSKNTAGGRVCFKTDSTDVAISCKRPSMWKMQHMALCASAGFDLYVRENGKISYHGTFMPTWDSAGYDSVLHFDTQEMRELIIHFPLYAPVTSLLVGTVKGSRLEKWDGYTYETPIVFYGSSVTQGACANTPGGDYISVACRRFDTNYINLGFSGSAKGEDAMMEYIASLDMSVFVYDYDYNAPNAEHLRKTHERGYLTVRKAHPDTPIILMTKANFDNPKEDCENRRAVIHETYEHAIAAGDKNIYFIDSKEAYGAFYKDDCTVDGGHPNALGHRKMADAVSKVLAKIFNA